MADIMGGGEKQNNRLTIMWLCLAPHRLWLLAGSPLSLSLSLSLRVHVDITSPGYPAIIGWSPTYRYHVHFSQPRPEQIIAVHQARASGGVIRPVDCGAPSPAVRVCRARS